MKRKEWEWDSDGVLEKSVFDLFCSGGARKKRPQQQSWLQTALEYPVNGTEGGGGVIHLRFWRGLSAPCHSSILPRKHKEHYAWSPEGLRASAMLSPGSAA